MDYADKSAMFGLIIKFLEADLLVYSLIAVLVNPIQGI